MSAVLHSMPGGITDPGAKQAFQKHLQAVVDKAYAAKNAGESVVELCNDICTLFSAERITIYVVGADKTSVTSKVKTGLSSFKDLKLPIGENSIAGFAALARRVLNIKNVYDEAELKAFSPRLKFLQEVDRRTGYRSKQMLVAPIADPQTSELLGVVQLINNKLGAPFGQLAEDGIQEVCKALAFALSRKGRPETQLLKTKYDGLIHDAVLSSEQFENAQRVARKKGVDLEQVLLEEFNVSAAQVGKALAEFFGVPYEPHRADRIKPMDLLRNLPREFVQSNHWLPIDDTKEGVRVLALDPERIKSSRVVNNVLGKAKVVYCVTTQREFAQTVDLFFGADGAEDIGDMLLAVDEDGEDGSDSSGDVSAAADNELVKLVNKVIIDAFNQGASDIHIESYPGKAKTEIRLRKDGALMPYLEVPASYRSAIVARIKIMCDLDISERRKPQDGKIKFKRFGPLDIELRVATLPVAGGVEDVVMRILASGEPIPLDQLALSDRNHDQLKNVISKPYGLFFVCGPTGSGKTTTLHSILKHLNTPDTKIWTAEDPVEITQKGLRQVQVNRKAGLDFATVMRAFLRADPDIIMVGEMRDKETTAIGIEASLTGHLVLATLHTNSAPESIVRLLDMGMDPFNFGDALLGVLAQRLARRLCSKCKEAYTPNQEELKGLLQEYCQELMNTSTFKRDPRASYEGVYAEWAKKFAREKGHFVLYRKKGCEHCGNSGYRGRVGLHELLVGTDDIKKLVQERSRVAEILAVGLEAGMRTLKQDGIEKVLQGVTDIHQIRMVCIK